MAKNSDADKKLVLETLHFLIAERNKALFQLNTCIAAELILKKDTDAAKKRVQGIRSRLLSELEKSKSILTEEDKRNFIEYYSQKDENETDTNDS